MKRTDDRAVAEPPMKQTPRSCENGPDAISATGGLIPATSASVTYSRRGKVVRLRLCRPDESTNAIGFAFLHDLHSALTRLKHAEGVRIVIFQGTGRTFSSGADLAEIGGLDTEGVKEFLRLGQDLLSRLLALSPVTIAAVNGLALGGGLELAVACDLRWAHKRAVFGFPEAGLGLVPGWGGPALMRSLVPPDVHEGMLVGTGRLTARRALGVGLIDRVYSDVSFEEAVLNAADVLAGSGADRLARIRKTNRTKKWDADLSEADKKFLTLWNEPGRASKLSVFARKDREAT